MSLLTIFSDPTRNFFGADLWDGSSAGTLAKKPKVSSSIIMLMRLLIIAAFPDVVCIALHIIEGTATV